MTILSDIELKEIMIDFNLDFLIDVHENLKERYYYTGLMQKSKSPDFIQTIFEHFKFEYIMDDLSHDEDDIYDFTIN